MVFAVGTGMEVKLTGLQVYLFGRWSAMQSLWISTVHICIFTSQSMAAGEEFTLYLQIRFI